MHVCARQATNVVNCRRMILLQRGPDKDQAGIWYWESYLSKHKFLAGNELTLADIAAGPFFLVYERQGATFKDFPKVAAYIAALKVGPSCLGCNTLKDFIHVLSLLCLCIASGLHLRAFLTANGFVLASNAIAVHM